MACKKMFRHFSILLLPLKCVPRIDRLASKTDVLCSLALISVLSLSVTSYLNLRMFELTWEYYQHIVLLNVCAAHSRHDAKSKAM